MGDGNYNAPFKVPHIKINPKLLIIFLMVILLGIVGVSTFYMVDQTEQAVVLRFGRVNRITEPGLHLKIPFGIESNYNVPTQVVQTMSFGFRSDRPGVTPSYAQTDYPEESVMLTGDLNIVDVEWVIQYRIVEPQEWLFKVEDKERTIRDISQSVINMLVGDRGIFDVIGRERVAIEASGQELINKILKSYKLGTNVTTVKLRNIVPPIGTVQDSFEDVNKAQQEMNRFIN
ncbi:MAG: FtsH protease activity modulator HflK, partial [Spirochaetia bacterium]|nr:FtsH protease activity modulator HflK [Spirochaetia bacterium]